MEDRKDYSDGADGSNSPVRESLTPSVSNQSQSNGAQFAPAMFNAVDGNNDLAPAKVNRTKELVEDVLHAGIIHKVNTDADVKQKILETANRVISTNLAIVDSNADKADKAAFFDANIDACSYFGFDETTTAKTHVKVMKTWAWVFNMLYIISVGFLVVAPIVFFCTKLRVVVKKTWIVLVLGLFIYALVVASPFIVTLLGGL